MNIIVSGSLAYDRIMDFPGYFSDHILADKIHNINVCFQVNGMVERFGGTAGNIAYALTLMGEKPLIYASIGRDYHQYFEWLERKGISTGHINIVENEFTACAYITTDKGDNQITGFNPGAMKFSAALDVEQFSPDDTMVIVSPGNFQDMVDYPRLCKGKGISYIFDPGQGLPMLKAADIIQAIDGCLLLICNDYELEMIINKTGLTRNALLKLAGTIIITKGEKGSVVYKAESELNIPAVRPPKVVDPTGAGDSYRGGLISGLIRHFSWEKSAIMGAVCSSFCLECYGTQEYAFNTREFEQRLKEYSGEF
jgi:adenosine kinase